MSWTNGKKSIIAAKTIQKWMGKPISYGIKFLDDALGGIYPDDLILLTAKTGGGKTELAANIAYNAAKSGRKVHFFALEAHLYEIETRLKFKLLAQAFYTQMNYSSFGKYPDYQEWLQSRQEDILEKFESEVDEILSQEIETLHTYYSDKEFNIENFEAEMGLIGDDTELVVLDHLHYFDFDSENENSAMKRTVKQIKNIVSFYRKPAIIVTQLRKADRFSTQLLPETEDIQGSSDIAKIATKIIVAGPARDQTLGGNHIFPTYFRITKNRTSGARTYFTALCGYDAFKNSYAKEYQLGNLTKNNSEFCLIEKHDYPQWARRMN